MISMKLQIHWIIILLVVTGFFTLTITRLKHRGWFKKILFLFFKYPCNVFFLQSVGGKMQFALIVRLFVFYILYYSQELRFFFFLPTDFTCWWVHLVDFKNFYFKITEIEIPLLESCIILFRPQLLD